LTSSSSSGGPPYTQGSLSPTGGPTTYVAPSDPLQTGLNTSTKGFVKRRAQLLQERTIPQTPTIQVRQTPNPPAFGITGVQTVNNKKKGGARNTRKYSKKQANRQTRRG
jgi:hypothetical protein